MGVSIHATAIVEKGAKLGHNVEVGPYAFIGKNVTLGDETKVFSHALITGHTKLGKRCTVWSFATIGSIPQDLKYKGEASELICGDDNKFREYCNISTGTEEGGAKTLIGNNNLFMVNTHVAHDCTIGNSCILANGVSLGGHITLGDHINIGGHSACHQFIHMGSYSIIGGGSIVVQDVPPCSIVHGNHAKPYGINIIGLKRNLFPKEEIQRAREIYKLIYRSELTVENSIKNIQSKIPPSQTKNLFIHFLENRSERGIVR